MASIDPTRLEKGYGSYFYGQFARDSFCGPLDPAFEAIHGLNESQIADFIRAARPRLFRELRNLPLYSTDVSETPLVSATGKGPLACCTQSLSPSLDHPRDVPSTVQSFARYEKLNLLETQHKQYLQVRVLNGSDLTVRKLIAPSLLMPCSDPKCIRDATMIPKGAFFLTLSQSLVGTSGGALKRSVRHYSLTCLERLFDQIICINKPCEVDGHFDDDLEMPDFPHNYPSNSPEAKLIRQKRSKEIETLTQVSPIGERSKDRLALGRSEIRTPNLKLRRPNDASPYHRRYRKQGLTYENKRKSGESGQSEQQQNDGASTEKKRPQEYRICYCREPAGESELISCSAKACMTGTFHLECLNLNQELEEGDEVYCSYCAEDLSAEESSDGDDDEALALLAKGAIATEAYTATPSPSAPQYNHDQNALETTAVESQESDSEANDDEIEMYPQGFTPVNSDEHDQFDGQRSPIPTKLYLQPISTSSTSSRRERPMQSTHVPLQPDSSQINFADLAPFISVSHQAHAPLGLANEEAWAVQKWKINCPKSRLSQGQPATQHSNGPIGRDMQRDDRNHYFTAVMENGSDTRRLSEMLKNVTGAGDHA